MREIKFKYIFDATEDELGIQVREFTLEQIEKNEPSNFMDCCFVNTDKITRLQFTGLKDKNGKDIYEGDIVTCWIPGMPHNMRATQEVFFENGMFTNGGTPLYLLDKKCLEVIGNRYENPELISN